MKNTKITYIVNGHEFDTYRKAEIFCGERGIMCDEIYEVEAE